MLRDELPPVAYFAGHSLGEYTALVAAGALEFEDAVDTVHERGRLMQEAVPPGEGAMAAVLRLATGQIEEINQDVSRRLGQDLVVANFNSPEQTVVSGSAAAVHEAIPLYEKAGARRVVELPVSAPFHSPLMVPAADGLKPRLKALGFASTRTPVIANLTVEPYPADPAQYPLLLHAQIFNPVRWAETCEYLATHGVTHLLEIGPGKVLRMLAVKTVRDMRTYNVDRVQERAQLAEWLGSLGGSSAGEKQ